MSKTKRYTVSYERDAESGMWTAVIDRAQGVSCVTYGRSLKHARTRIREALAVYLDDEQAAAKAELIDDVKLPATLKRAADKAARMRDQAERMQIEAMRIAQDLARKLVARGLSSRDVGEVVGLSHQWANRAGEPIPRQRPVSKRRKHVVSKHFSPYELANDNGPALSPTVPATQTRTARRITDTAET